MFTGGTSNYYQNGTVVSDSVVLDSVEGGVSVVVDSVEGSGTGVEIES